MTQNIQEIFTWTNGEILDDEEHPRRRQKKLLKRKLDLKQIKPLNKNQGKAFSAFRQNKNLLMHGAAGTGKTYLAVHFALSELIAGNVSKIYVVRSAVPTRDQGFLPGSLSEKMSLYEAPYRDIFDDLCGKRDVYDHLKEKDHYEFMSTSYIRGLNIPDSIIILDEVQNFSFHEISSVITRVGENSRVIMCGDTQQNDLAQQKGKGFSGLDEFVAVARKMNSFEIIQYEASDIVRSGLVKEFLLAKIECGIF